MDKMNKKVFCVFWAESLSSPNHKAWSLHLTEEDARKFIQYTREAVYDSYGDFIPVEKTNWVMTNQKEYNKLMNSKGRGEWVERKDFVSIQLEMFE